MPILFSTWIVTKGQNDVTIMSTSISVIKLELQLHGLLMGINLWLLPKLF